MYWIPSWNRQGGDRPRSAGNFVGDGINAAKRIMGFAEPAKSRRRAAFFDAVACLDAAYAALFGHAGAPTTSSNA
jgi:hypothetical protein